jgi:hypothetical protein
MSILEGVDCLSAFISVRRRHSLRGGDHDLNQARSNQVGTHARPHRRIGPINPFVPNGVMVFEEPHVRERRITTHDGAADDWPARGSILNVKSSNAHASSSLRVRHRRAPGKLGKVPRLARASERGVLLAGTFRMSRLGRLALFEPRKASEMRYVCGAHRIKNLLQLKTWCSEYRESLAIHHLCEFLAIPPSECNEVHYGSL